MLSQFHRELQDKRNLDFTARVRAFTRCLSFGFAFDQYQAANEGDPPIFEQVDRILEICGGRLKGFRQLGPYLSYLPPALWTALRKYCPAIECLEGFNLELVTQNTTDFVQELATLPNLKRLTTTIVWLPPSSVPDVRRRMPLTEQEKLRCGLLGDHSKKRFAYLESLRTPLLRWDNLFIEALMVATLPRLHSLQLDVWDSDSVLRFLEKHGRKLVHVDLLQCRWSGWPEEGRTRLPQPVQRNEERFQIEDIFTSCPSLKVFTIHQTESLASLAERAPVLGGRSSLEVLRIGSTCNSSYASMQEYQPFDEISFPFKDKAHLRTTRQNLLATDWNRLFPKLRRIEVYLPEFMLDPTLVPSERDRRWKEAVAGMVKSKHDRVSPWEVERAMSGWQRDLRKRGIALIVRPSPKVAQWQKASSDLCKKLESAEPVRAYQRISVHDAVSSDIRYRSGYRSSRGLSSLLVHIDHRVAVYLES